MNTQQTFPRFSASAFSLSFDDTKTTFEMLRNAGFSGIEGHVGIADSRDEFRKLGERALRHEIPFTSYHLRFTAKEDVASFYETSRKAAIESIIDDLENAAALGAGTVILHPSTNHFDTNVEGSDQYLDKLCSSLDKIVPEAERLGIRIAVENMMNPGVAVYFSIPEHIHAFRKRVDHPAVGFCLDTGHSLVSLGPDRQLEILEAMGDRLIALHLQDNSRIRDIHIAPGHGFVDFKSTFRRIRDLGIDVVMCLECAPFTPYYPFTPEAWSELVADTRTLAEPED